MQTVSPIDCIAPSRVDKNICYFKLLGRGESNRAGPGEAQMTGKVELLTAPGQAETVCDMIGVLSHSQLMRYFN